MRPKALETLHCHGGTCLASERDMASPKTKKILIVDDHESILLFLERLLARPSIQFIRAARGEEALSLARTEHPDIVLVDVCMPGMDGLEVCEAIKNDPDLAGTRVVLMSAVVGEAGLRDGCEQFGADGCVGKPFNPEVLRRGIDLLLGCQAAGAVGH